MATVYGKKRPGQSGWQDFEEAVSNYLEDDVDGYAVTYEMREHARAHGLGEYDNRARKKERRKQFRLIALVVMVVGIFGGGFLAIFSEGLGTAFMLAGTIAIFYLFSSGIGSIERRMNRKLDNDNYVNQNLEKLVKDKRDQEVARLVALAREGRFEETGLPNELQRAARGYKAEEQIGEMLEQQLPESIQIAHDVIIHRDSRDGLTKILDGIEGAQNPMLYGSTSGSRKFGAAMGVLGALGELTSESAVTANADHVLSTAAGIIMVDTKHWSGELSLNEAGQFTAGPNHPGSVYREQAAEITRFEASRINDGDVTAIILAVVGGTVRGGILEQSDEGGIPILAVEAENLVQAITNLHNSGRLREPVPLKKVEINSPGTKWQ